MLIIGSKSGQLANRLFVFSHFIANAIEYDYTVVNLKFYEYVSFFEATSKNYFNGYPVYIKFANNSRLNAYITAAIRYILNRLSKSNSSLIHKNYSIFDAYDNLNIDFDLNSTDFLSDVKTKVVIAYGWSFRDNKNFIKHAPLIRSFFRPIQTHKDNVDKLIQICRKDNPILVGVHIRKGDYKEFMGGKYYFHTNVYAQKLNQIKKLFEARDHQVVFLICSNENIEIEWLQGVQYYLGTGHFVEDLYSLAACDYLLGVPSTYIRWASFYGNVPLCTIHQQNDSVDITSFKI